MLSRRFVLLLSLALLAQGLVGGVVKILGGETGDLLHNALHAIWGAAGLRIVLRTSRQAVDYAVVFGLFYLALAGIGVASGGFPLLPLAAGDHVFHAAVGLTTLAVGLWGRSRARTG